MKRPWGFAVAALATLSLPACQPDTCSDIECVMNHIQLTVNGQSLPLTEVPTELVPIPASYTPSSSGAANSFDLLIMPVSMPNFGDPLELVEAGYSIHAGSGMPDESQMPTIDNQPADVQSMFDGQGSFELDVTDPNGASPANLLILGDPSSGRLYTKCAWMMPELRDFLVKLKNVYNIRFNSVVDFAATGFWDSGCNTLPPRRSLVLPYGPDACPQGTQRCGDDSCIPSTTLCTPGAGTCGTDGHYCGMDCVARSVPCCTFFENDPGCCPDGPGKWPCVVPAIAGPAVQLNVKPPLGGGGGGNNNGGGGGADEIWHLPRGPQIAEVTIHGDGSITSSGVARWKNLNSTGDCSFPLDITGRMSGTTISISVMGSGCGGYGVTGGGSGQADGVFGVAMVAAIPYNETDTSAGQPPVNMSGTIDAVRVQ